MKWLAKILGKGNVHQVLDAREEDVPGFGRLRIAYVVDCMGAMCPRPQLLTMKMVGLIKDGEVLEVISDNPAAIESFPSLAESLSCTHLTTIREQGYWRLYLRKDPNGVVDVVPEIC